MDIFGREAARQLANSLDFAAMVDRNYDAAPREPVTVPVRTNARVGYTVAARPTTMLMYGGGWDYESTLEPRISPPLSDRPQAPWPTRRRHAPEPPQPPRVAPLARRGKREVTLGS